MKETRAGSLSPIPNKASLYTRRTIPTDEKKWITVHAHSRYGGDLAVSISKTVTTMLRHFDREEKQPDASDLRRQREESNITKIKMDFYVMHELLKDIMAVFQSSQN